MLTELETAAAIASGGSLPAANQCALPLSQAAMGKPAAQFALKHPEVRLEVKTEDRPVDRVEEVYDLVIRVHPAMDESLVGRIFLRDRIVAVAAPQPPRPPEGAHCTRRAAC